MFDDCHCPHCGSTDLSFEDSLCNGVNLIDTWYFCNRCGNTSVAEYEFKGWYEKGGDSIGHVRE